MPPHDPSRGSRYRLRRAPQRRLLFQFFFQFGDAAEFLEGSGVVDLQQFGFIQGSDVLDRDLDAVHRAQDAATELLQLAGKIFDLVGGIGKEGIETISECRIVRRVA